MLRAILILALFLHSLYAQAMNARGERILIFGDSLTQHASGSNPIWDVNAGAQRTHSGPGDLLASLLLEQGAKAVRTNALVSRSAFNFWSREAAQQLVAADLAWQPTKIVFVLGTNDIGLATAPDEEAFRKLVAAYQPSGAELWAIGPFVSGKPPAEVAKVAGTMQRVFGSRFIDGRELSKLISPGPDGLHYTPTSARLLALNMADALLSTNPKQAWQGIAIGAAVVVGLGVAYSAWTKRRDLAGVEIVDGRRWDRSTAELVRSGARQVPCKSGLDRNGQARCWSRGLGLLAGPKEDRERLQEAIADFKDIARQEGYSGPEAMAEFIKHAKRAGVPLVAYQYDLTSAEDVTALREHYDLDAKAVRELKKRVAEGDEGHEIVVTPDGYAIDWTSRFRSGSGPFVFRIPDFETSAPPPPPPPPAPATRKIRTLPAATRGPLVEAAARAVGPEGRFGDKVFVSDVHEEIIRRGYDISLPDFKRELARMAQYGETVMTRADLVGVMDKRRVAESEIEDDRGVVHFVDVGQIDLKRRNDERARQRGGRRG